MAGDFFLPQKIRAFEAILLFSSSSKIYNFPKRSIQEL